MSQRNGQDHAPIAVSLAAALLVHGLLAGGLGAAEHFGWMTASKKAEAVEMVIIARPPPPPPVEEPPPPPPPPEEKLPPPPAKIVEKTPVKPAKIVKAPPPPTEATPPPPAPGPEVDDAPAEAYHFEMPASAQGGGTMPVPQGAGPRGSARGVPGGKGGGAGGPPDSGGTGPRVASIASVKQQPIVDGDFDRVALGKDYPAEAKRLGIQGQVQVRLLVDDKGRVVQTRLHKGLGYGLDERAIALGKTIKFRPAVDSDDKPVAMWITWSFNFELPQ